MNPPKITIIGAGNGGQAMAGHCAALGVQEYVRTPECEKKSVKNNPSMIEYK